MSERTVWITGASSGIGRAVALQMARDGWRVVGSARRQEALDELAAEGPAGRITGVAVDVTDPEATRAAVARIEAEIGPIDRAILAAGTHIPTSADDFKPEDFRTLVEVNLMGVVHATAAVLPGFKQRRAGHLVVVASVAGYGGLPTAAGYGATKAGLINFTESMKFDLDEWGVKTQLVCPGFVRTPLTDRNEFSMPFLMKVEDAAEAMVKGMEGGGFEITFPKRFTWLVKAMSALPYALYFPMVRKGTRK
ncbi:SDR family NAD(P)-dependent oxidoreductase [Thalassobaculum salexigens]|uniref:SDR family NAD(P)-dependent oxidoreductase n=1 Tax=Thalassobaculum salexigens TaxID=455360 RepID=UPI000421F2C5|nr:SDR family NAD(P)-dependent oxidoreductase [Thalassobaculum salexigens]